MPNHLKVNSKAESSLDKLYLSTHSRYNEEMEKVYSFRDLSPEEQ